MYDVGVVIATFRRPELLAKTVLSVAEQVNSHNLKYKILVVDNCPERSAESTVTSLIEQVDVPLRYISEPRQNISLARNAGLDSCDAEFVAMIDDDALAPPDWLDWLVTAIRTFDADVVAGPTVPVFEKETPNWLDRSGLSFDRRRDIPTGTELEVAGSGNVLMKSATCLAANNRFDPALGRHGGSDTDFFMRLTKTKGCKIVWSNEAVVEEFVPADRLTVRYLLRRVLRSNQGFVWCSVRYSDHPIRTAAYFMLVVGCSQIAIAIIPSLILAPFPTGFSVRARTLLVKGIGKLFWGRRFMFNFY
jgi:glycosyltransferase involved in cell wall biosynthesis